MLLRSNDPDLATPLCLNCHAKLHAGLLDAGLGPPKGRTVPEVLAAILGILGFLLQALGERMATWAAKLLAFVRALDAKDPSWRDLPEAMW